MSMDLEEVGLLLDSAERWFSANNPIENRVALFRNGHHEDAGAWRAIAEMGWLALPLPEDAGGFDAGHAAGLALIRRAGRHARPEALDVYMMLAPIVTKALPDASAALIEGRMRLGVADLTQDKESLVVQEGDLPVLDGNAGPVLGAEFATHFIIPARQQNGLPRLVVMAADALGVTKREARLIDARTTVLLSFKAAQGQWLDVGQEASLAQKALDLAAAGMVADSAGVIEAAFNLTLDYLKQRVQFGKPLSAQQAVQHKMAEVFCDLQQLFALAERLGLEMDGAPHGPWPTLAVAKSFVGRRALRAVGQLVQLSGGIGVTEEYKLTHFYRRLHVAAEMFGAAEAQLARINTRDILLAA